MNSHNQSDSRLVVSSRYLAEPNAHPVEEPVFPRPQGILHDKVLKIFSSCSKMVKIHKEARQHEY